MKHGYFDGFPISFRKWPTRQILLAQPVLCLYDAQTIRLSAHPRVNLVPIVREGLRRTGPVEVQEAYGD